MSERTRKKEGGHLLKVIAGILVYLGANFSTAASGAMALRGSRKPARSWTGWHFLLGWRLGVVFVCPCHCAAAFESRVRGVSNPARDIYLRLVLETTEDYNLGFRLFREYRLIRIGI